MSLHFPLLTSLTAFALLSRTEWGYYFVNRSAADTSPFVWIYGVLALLVLLKPNHLPLFLAMLTAQVLDVLWIAPVVPNHWLIMTCASLTWCLATIYLWIKNRRLPSTDEAIVAVLPGLQLGVALFYLFTAFWKSNTGFFNPEYSCVLTRYLKTIQLTYGIPKGELIDWSVMVGTLSVEYVAPFLLLIPKTRLPAVLIMSGFHFLLALDQWHNYQNFSWVMFALLAVFIPADALRHLAAIRLKVPVWYGQIFIAAVCLSLVALSQANYPLWWDLRWAWAMAGALLWCGTVAWLVWQEYKSGQKTAARFTWPQNIAWICVALVFLNGISPIIGLKTRNSWQMYSNINIDAGLSNHWFLPPSLDLFGFLKDTVEIVETNDSVLQNEYIKTQSRITWFDLRNRVLQNPTMSLTWRRDDGMGVREYSTVNAGADPRLAPEAWLWRKVAWFRPIGEYTAKQCAW
jgi:hypothetical protein